jgi:hypothetical protein
MMCGVITHSALRYAQGVNWTAAEDSCDVLC